MAKNAFKLSTMVGENFEFTHFNWLKMHLNYPPWLEKILEFTHLKWLKMHLNYPPWLEKILEFTHFNWLKNALKFSTMVGENFEIHMPGIIKNDPICK